MSILETNRYLQGNYGPVEQEVTAYDLPIQGELPAELRGRYVRNGPNSVTEPDPESYHWFMGDGMVHGLRINEGRAEWYRNRWVGSRKLAQLRGQDDVPGAQWNGGPVGANTNVAGFAGTTWATVEAGGCPVELNYELETVGRNDFYGTLPGAFTAHPKLDPDSGEMHAMVHNWPRWGERIQYVVVGADGRVSRAANIPLAGMTMLHDMSLTSRFAVIYDQPVTLDFNLAGEGMFPFRWNPDHGNRVGLVPRNAPFERLVDEIVWVDVPLGFAFHPLNAYDTPDGKVVIDICNYQRMFDEDRFGPFESLPGLERWELDPKRRTTSTTVIDETPNEFPRHRGSLTSKQHRYGYCVAPSNDPSEGWPTIKHDLATGARQVFDHGPGRCAGEAVFVPRETNNAEDDGWLLCFVHDLARASAEFVVMDAQDFGRGYVAQVQLPQRIPFGFHGNWISDNAVAPPPPRPEEDTSAGAADETDGSAD
ncbi:MAG: carotenoid oxygenase family protein [Acidimicrobiales bacterium]